LTAIRENESTPSEALATAAMRFRPTIVVLAAGLGTRFAGTQPKLAQPFAGAGGLTVLGATLRHAIETQLSVVVVTTAALAPLAARQLARRDIVELSPAEAARGMGHSIATGVAERSGAPGWLLLPGDMPLVRPSSILAVASALEQHPVVYAQYQGRRGHPVGFAAELYSELVMLTGDEGARRLLARYPAHGQEVADPGVLIDVDTVDDLETARRLALEAAGDRLAAGS
jgi:molybdenum cofactor cytidylyltransferase